MIAHRWLLPIACAGLAVPDRLRLRFWLDCALSRELAMQPGERVVLPLPAAR